MPLQGETIPIYATCEDEDGDPVEPDSHEIKIYDSTGTIKLTETSPTDDGGGLYHINYDIPSDGALGKWEVQWKTVKNGDTDIEVISFNVAEVGTGDMTYLDILNVGHWTQADIEASIVEDKIDDAVDMITLKTGLSISNMQGDAESKYLTCTSVQKPVIKFLAALYCIAYITGGSAVGLNINVGGLNASTVAKCPPLDILMSEVETGIEKLVVNVEADEEIPFLAVTEPID